MGCKNFFQSILLLLFLASCRSEKTDPVVDCNTSDLTLQVVEVLDELCGLENGQIEVSASGGKAPYQYSLNGQSAVPSELFSDLAASQYTLRVIDANNCEATISATVNILDGLQITELNSTDAGCKASDGSLAIVAESGNLPYQYSIDGGSMQESASFSGLESGDHELLIRDADGCEINQELYLASGVSFTDQISDIVINSCAIDGCHSGTQFPDFRVFKNIQDNSLQMKLRTGTREMPQTGTLTQDQIDLIACWVDDGALEN